MAAENTHSSGTNGAKDQTDPFSEKTIWEVLAMAEEAVKHARDDKEVLRIADQVLEYGLAMIQSASEKLLDTDAVKLAYYLERKNPGTSPSSVISAQDAPLRDAFDTRALEGLSVTNFITDEMLEKSSTLKIKLRKLADAFDWETSALNKRFHVYDMKLQDDAVETRNEIVNKLYARTGIDRKPDHTSENKTPKKKKPVPGSLEYDEAMKDVYKDAFLSVLTAAAVFAVIGVLAFMFIRYWRPEIIFRKATALYEEGNHEAALEKYEKIAEYKDAPEKIKSIREEIKFNESKEIVEGRREAANMAEFNSAIAFYLSKLFDSRLAFEREYEGDKNDAYYKELRVYDQQILDIFWDSDSKEYDISKFNWKDGLVNKSLKSYITYAGRIKGGYGSRLKDYETEEKLAILDLCNSKFIELKEENLALCCNEYILQLIKEPLLGDVTYTKNGYNDWTIPARITNRLRISLYDFTVSVTFSTKKAPEETYSVHFRKLLSGGSATATFHVSEPIGSSNDTVYVSFKVKGPNKVELP